jgi:hypothetical protein
MSSNVYTNTFYALTGVGTSQKVYIQPRQKMTMTIRVSVTTTLYGQTYEDYIAKKIIVENDGIADCDTRVAILRPTLNAKDEQTFTFSTDGVNPNSIEMKAVVSGNIMGGALSSNQLGL